MPRECHIASMLIHARPDQLGKVAAQVETLGLEIHVTDPGGKLIVTQETHSTGVLGETLTALQLLEGVHAATMVFHHCETLEDDPDTSFQETEPREVQP